MKKRRKINERLTDVFNFIVEFKKAHDGLSPTVREIGEACKISSTSVVAYYLKKLQDEGSIKLLGTKTRGIMVKNGRWNLV